MRVDNTLTFGWKPEVQKLNHLWDAELVSYIREVYGYAHTYKFGRSDLPFFDGLTSLVKEAEELVSAIKQHGRIIFEVEKL